MLDLLVGYSHRTINVSSRDPTSFQSPLGALQNISLPMGSTNSVAIFHGDITFILKPEIPNITKPFVYDIVVKGLASHFKISGGEYETLLDSIDIQKFIWDHLNNVH